MIIGAVAAPAAGQSISQTLREQVKIQRSLLASEVVQLEDHRARIEEAWIRVERESADLLRAQEQGESLESLQLRDEDLRQAESELLMYLFSTQRLRREMLASRATIAATEEEIRRLEDAVGAGDDPLTGTWRVVMEPGGQEGLMFLRLEGTLVQGTYKLSGDWTGSVRGTFVSRKVRLERIDSQAGFSAILNGRLLVRGRISRLQGSWEAKELSSGMPSAGTWAAERIEDDEN
jgi:hypothetical protein